MHFCYSLHMLFSLSHSFADSNLLIHTPTRSHSLSLTHSHSFSLTHSLLLILTLSYSLSRTLTHSHSLSLTHSHSHSLTLTHSFQKPEQSVSIKNKMAESYPRWCWATLWGAFGYMEPELKSSAETLQGNLVS